MLALRCRHSIAYVAPTLEELNVPPDKTPKEKSAQGVSIKALLRRASDSQLDISRVRLLGAHRDLEYGADKEEVLTNTEITSLSQTMGTEAMVKEAQTVLPGGKRLTGRSRRVR